jgi:hypothetical protein
VITEQGRLQPVDELAALGAGLKALTDEINHARLRGFLREALEEKET